MSEQQAAELLSLLRQMAGDIADLKQKTESIANNSAKVAFIANHCFDGHAMSVSPTA